ncbi:MAG: hypothetical protein AB2L14_31205 [Candidatus Xenobiia bacterium LiM19]
MVKTIIAVILIVLALACMGSTVYEYFTARGRISLWSEDVMGACAFHGICMIIAAFLLSSSAGRKEGITASEDNQH